ncbi:MAG TPA: rod shape-determining protein RodA [Candidatus Krumholzibacteria bacterium]|nr:rod shape-determining protein RodA [Candidatus Krumholzibacteria bacterium]HPD71361.1 rod shape-determining protein RodA [Candidatus Krumholzibacteria bacterium]HRY38939.1 rod shape-determining protein RodA [Candidatus Krumholzibacteria bacterium]
MMLLQLLLPRGDRRLLAAYAALVLFSLALLWSVTEPPQGPYAEIQVDVPKAVFVRQLVWAVVSWLAVTIVSRIPLRHLENLAWPGYLGVCALLVGVLLIAPEVAGSRRWLAVGNLRLQPSEFAKVAVVVLLATWLSRRLEDRSRIPATLGSLVLVLVPAVLVLREPDLGTSLVFLAIWLGMIFCFGISGLVLSTSLAAIASAVIMFYSERVAQQAWPWGIYLLLLIGALYLLRLSMSASVLVLLCNIAAGLGIPLLWGHLEPYQQERILTFFDPTRDEMGTGYQAIQSKVAIGSGGLFGTHYLQGTQKGLAFLPERHTDFIFSVAGEELGLFGAVILLGLFLLVVLRATDVATEARRPFASLLAIGIASYFTFHVVVNVSITTGLLPVTGLPLPLISYGGSNLLVSSLMVGLLLNLSAHGYDA